MNAQKYFEQHAEELIASYAGKNVVLFFRGFVQRFGEAETGAEPHDAGRRDGRYL